MIEQGLFKKYFVGRDGFYWWIGQIAPQETWRDNKLGIPSDDNKDTPGFGERYKVRIMGHHTAVPSELPDDELPWATVMYPVTAGGGTGSCSQSANLRQGMFVFGFFMDGEDGQQPVIMGVIGTNSYTAVMKNVPDAKFIPFSGLSPEYGEQIATYARIASGSEGEVAPVAEEAKGEPQENKQVINSVEGNTEVTDAASESEAKDGKDKETAIPKPSECNEIPLSGLQLQLTNSIKEIENLRKSLEEDRVAAIKGVSDKEARVAEEKDKMNKAIAEGLKWVIDEITRRAENVGNEINREIQGALGPHENYAGEVGYSKTIDAIVCGIKAVLDALSTYLQDLVDSIVDKVINLAKCFIEDFVASIIAQIDNLISQFINNLFDTVYSAINQAFGLADSGLDLAQSILGFVQDIFSLFDCESDPACKQYNTEQWNILTGGRTDRESAGDIMEKAKGFSSEFNQVFDFALGITDVLENQFEFNFDSVFDQLNCDIGPIFCGPPGIALFGGTGAGFAANPIISDSGSVIGIDVVSMGSGYGDGSYAKIVDACGNGNGGVIIPYLGQFEDQLWDWLNGDDNRFGDEDDLLGRGRRGVLDSYWQNRRFELERGDGGATGPSILAGLGTIFTGRIGPERLDLGGDLLGDGVGIGTTSIIDPILVKRPIDVRRENQQSIFEGNITADSGRLNTGTSGFSTVVQGLGEIPGGGGEENSTGEFRTDITSLAFTGLSDDTTSIIDPPTVTAVGVSTADLPTDSILNQGVVGFIIRDGGTGYLTKPDGSKGGMNRTWSKADQTTVQKKDGVWLLPSSPGKILKLEEGDTVEMPPGTRVITEQADDGTGGGEEILGGSPYTMKNNGNITTPFPVKGTTGNKFPTGADGTYPVILYLRAIYVDIPGTSYQEGDEVIISPSNGAKASIKTTNVGGVYKIKVTKTGEGFKEMPKVYIKSDTGIGARLLPQLGVNRVEEDKLDAETASKVVNVTDTTGTIASAY